MKTVLLLVGGATASRLFERPNLAKAILSRQRRNNNGLFEEARAANLQRECIDEICSWDEVFEVFEDTANTNKWWDEATKQCNQPDACHAPGTKTCVNLWRDKRCECKDGWINNADSKDCSTDIDECQVENFCENGGGCTNLEGSFQCECAGGWEGDRCQQDKDECLDENACNGHGSCTNTDGGFTCACNAQWEGEFCEIDVDECAQGTSQCENESKCINTAGDYKCLCMRGWGGNRCGEDFDECGMSNACPVGTVCRTDGMNSFVCECPERGCNNLNLEIYEQLQQQVYTVPVEGSAEEEETGGGNTTTVTVNDGFLEETSDDGMLSVDGEDLEIGVDVEENNDTDDVVVTDADESEGSEITEAPAVETSDEMAEDVDTATAAADATEPVEDVVATDELPESIAESGPSDDSDEACDPDAGEMCIELPVNDAEYNDTDEYSNEDAVQITLSCGRIPKTTGDVSLCYVLNENNHIITINFINAFTALYGSISVRVTFVYIVCTYI